MSREKISKREEKGNASVTLCGCAPPPGRTLCLKVWWCFTLQREVQVTAVRSPTFHLQCGVKAVLDSGRHLHCWHCSEIYIVIGVNHSCTVCMGVEFLLGYSLGKTSLVCCKVPFSGNLGHL